MTRQVGIAPSIAERRRSQIDGADGSKKASPRAGYGAPQAVLRRNKGRSRTHSRDAVPICPIPFAEELKLMNQDHHVGLEVPFPY